MITEECRAKEARWAVRAAKIVSQSADLAYESRGAKTTMGEYQVRVREWAIQTAELASLSAELMRQAANEASYGASGTRMMAIWGSLAREAGCFAAHAGAAIVEAAIVEAQGGG
jgi:hypothetical protein